MALFKKKKKKEAPELPPPPKPPSEEENVRKLGDIPAIKPKEVPEETPEPEATPTPVPTPELPPLPKPEEKPAEIPTPEIPTPQPVEWKPEEIPRVEEALPIEEKPERARKPVGPVFVAMDEYQKILDDSNKVRAKLMEAEEFIKRLQELKDEEEKTFDRWRAHLEDVERKLTRIDKLLGKAK